ncbi:hypothetical protein CCACVL1_27193 [Corchorus capsularis]|uniref:Uncharacterized protein n=1 Tax=Corchorus capsularis TaxID=210143 RepID=A0A1R3GBR4_COCAP|nr:hypothetical protein CCACVL1_27193 [Corchorus capsularis]
MARSLLSIFLSALHKNRGFQRKENNTNKQGKRIMSSEKKLLSKINSNLGSKAQLMVKLVSWKKVQASAEEEEEEEHNYDQINGTEEAVWRKKIMMGERCRPLDFSGTILYDCYGNLLPSESTTTRQGDHKSKNKVILLGK